MPDSAAVKIKFEQWASPENTLKAVEEINAGGYASLLQVFRRAFAQAACGKGVERHAQAGERFEEQTMQDMAKRFGVGALLGQAFKKSEESQRLPHDRKIAELLGAINYLAGAVIAIELEDQRMQQARSGMPPPANDNVPVTPHG